MFFVLYQIFSEKFLKKSLKFTQMQILNKNLSISLSNKFKGICISLSQIYQSQPFYGFHIRISSKFLNPCIFVFPPFKPNSFQNLLFVDKTYHLNMFGKSNTGRKQGEITVHRASNVSTTSATSKASAVVQKPAEGSKTNRPNP